MSWLTTEINKYTIDTWLDRFAKNPSFLLKFKNRG